MYVYAKEGNLLGISKQDMRGMWVASVYCFVFVLMS